MKILFICFTLYLASSQFVYNEGLAKELGAMAFAAYCPNNALTSWNTGYVSRNYPNIEKVQVFEYPDLV